MITKTKISVFLSSSLLVELYSFNRNINISELTETALSYYLNELKRQERIKRDIKIINANAKRFNKEAEENLEFQDVL